MAPNESNAAPRPQTRSCTGSFPKPNHALGATTAPSVRPAQPSKKRESPPSINGLQRKHRKPKPKKSLKRHHEKKTAAPTLSLAPMARGPSVETAMAFHHKTTTAAAATATTLAAWSNYVHHEPMRGRTDDPAALQLDDACALFRKSLRDIRNALAARNGHDAASADHHHHQDKLHEACSIMIQAILTDPRCVKLCEKLPIHDQWEASHRLVDRGLVEALSVHRGSGNVWLLHRVFQIMMMANTATSLAHQTLAAESEYEGCFALIDELVREIKPFVIQRITETAARGSQSFPSLIATLSRWNLFFAAAHVLTRKWDDAEVELIQCQQRDDSFMAAQYLLALLHTRKDHAQPSKKVYNEWLCFIQKAHKDDYNLSEAYSWLAFLTFHNTDLGTFEQATHFLERSDVAHSRRSILYSRVQHSPFRSWLYHREIKDNALTLLRTHSNQTNPTVRQQQNAKGGGLLTPTCVEGSLKSTHQTSNMTPSPQSLLVASTKKMSPSSPRHFLSPGAALGLSDLKEMTKVLLEEKNCSDKKRQKAHHPQPTTPTATTTSSPLNPKAPPYQYHSPQQHLLPRMGQHHVRPNTDPTKQAPRPPMTLSRSAPIQFVATPTAIMASSNKLSVQRTSSC